MFSTVNNCVGRHGHSQKIHSINIRTVQLLLCSRMHMSSDKTFFKILKKPSIVQKWMLTHMKAIEKKQKITFFKKPKTEDKKRPKHFQVCQFSTKPKVVNKCYCSNTYDIVSKSEVSEWMDCIHVIQSVFCGLVSRKHIYFSKNVALPAGSMLGFWIQVG